VYAHETHAYKVIAEEPEIKSVIKDELLKELLTSLRRSVTAARLIPEYAPDSFHSCRYYPIGIYESPISINQAVVEMSQNQVVIIGKALLCAPPLSLVKSPEKMCPAFSGLFRLDFPCPYISHMVFGVRVPNAWNCRYVLHSIAA
jgi:hypothetical protein